MNLISVCFTSDQSTLIDPAVPVKSHNQGGVDGGARLKMTISYQLDVSRASVRAFLKLLFRWRASLWKNVYRELIAWCIVYGLIAVCYRSPYIMTAEQKMRVY